MMAGMKVQNEIMKIQCVEVQSGISEVKVDNEEVKPGMAETKVHN